MSGAQAFPTLFHHFLFFFINITVLQYLILLGNFASNIIGFYTLLPSSDVPLESEQRRLLQPETGEKYYS